MIATILAFLSKFLTDILTTLLSKPKVTGSTAHGKNPLVETPADDLADRARRSGLLGLVALLCLSGCGTTHIMVATLYPKEDAPGGWPRLAQEEVQVIMDDGTVGTLKGAEGYRLIHDADLKALLKRSGLK